MNSQITKNNNVLELGKTYQFAGYKWTACELINKGKTLVIQSHGVTHGAWPGYVMPQFGNGNFYAADIDGEDISAYDDKMQTLYDAIKDAEDSSTSYGKGLFLISKEKVGFTEWGKSGSGNYWQALKKTAENACSFGSPDNYAWLGTVYGSGGAWYVNRDGNIYEYFQDYQEFVIAPAFNLDLSKVKVVDNEIVIIDNKFGISLIEKPDVYGLVKSEIIKMYDMLDTDEVYPLEISGSQSSAMGFIAQKAAEVIDYDYENSGLNEFISSILDDMDKESEDGIYNFHGIKIHLER